MLRRLGGWLLVVVGLLFAVAGTAAAVVVGPDNQVDAGTSKVSSPGAAVVTAPGVIGIAGPTVRLEATSSAGEVFLGAGAEVDVRDLVAAVTRTQVDDVTMPGGDLKTSEVQGDADFLAGVPDLDWWLESDAGDPAVIEFPLPDKPISVVLMNADGSAPVAADVSVALSVPGLFWGMIALLVLGIGLLLFGWLVLRRARALRRTEPDKSAESQT